MTFTRRLWLKLAALFTVARSHATQAAEVGVDPARPFGADFPNLDSLAVGEWWTKPHPKGPNAPPPMDVPREQVVAFAVYTVFRDLDPGTWFLQSNQVSPEGSPCSSSRRSSIRSSRARPREARLEFQRDGEWVEVAQAPVLYPGWSAHFRVENWDAHAGRAVSRAARRGRRCSRD